MSEGRTKHQVFLSLGSNLGDRSANIERAITLINERVGEVIRCSSLIETVPWGYDSENNFLNAAILCETELSPRQVLRKTLKIERDLGRKKKTPSSGAYSDRPIDIDILLYDDLKMDEPDLVIPHPLMLERDFVMIPLREIQEDGVSMI